MWQNDLCYKNRRQILGRNISLISVINVENVGLTHYRGIKPRDGLILVLTCA